MFIVSVIEPVLRVGSLVEEQLAAQRKECRSLRARQVCTGKLNVRFGFSDHGRERPFLTFVATRFGPVAERHERLPKGDELGHPKADRRVCQQALHWNRSPRRPRPTPANGCFRS